MALIGKIRQHGWFLILVMALCLGGFILMDIVSNSQRYASGDANTIGAINGTEVSREDFEEYREAVYKKSTGNDNQVRTQVWNHFVDKAIITKEAEQLGLGVCKDELLELQFGNNLSPIIQERFRGQNGQIDRNQLNSIKSAIETGNINVEEPQLRQFWDYWAVQENEIIQQRLQDKLLGLVNKSMYTPSWLAEAVFKEGNERLSFNYVRVPYDKVADGDAPVTDADYSAFLKENPHLYDQTEEQRIMSYVSFEVTPTKTDSVDAYNKVVTMRNELRVAKNDSLYIVNHGGIYEDGYKTKKDLAPEVADRLLSTPIDSVVGPYLDGGNWTIAQIVGRKLLPDSVRARHILVRDATPASEAKIDSLKALINSGKPFGEVAIANSQDPGSGAKGGDLGFFGNGAMVAEFNNVCFNTGEQGKLYKVATQFGWHLIEITGKKFTTNSTGVQAAYLSERIVPGKNTQQVIKEQALVLLQGSKNLTDLSTLAGTQNLQVQTSAQLKANDFSLGALGQGTDARSMIQWAFGEDVKEGEISKQIFNFVDQTGGYFDNRYVVAGLKSIAPKGNATVASLKGNARVESEVKNRKKAEVIKGQLQGVSDLGSAAGKYQLQVDTAANVTLLSASIPKAGPEPRVVGTAFSMANGAVSKPIAGNSGVYVIQTIGDKSQVTAPADMTMFRRQATSTALTNVRMNFLTELKKHADIKDNRARFF